MEIILIAIHVFVCIALIMIVLLQTGKGADMGAAFGGGSSQTLFGSSGASTFLSKMTTAAAIVFMLTSLLLAYISTNRQPASIMSDKPAVEQPAAEAPSQGDTAPAAESEQPASGTSEGSNSE